MLRLYGTGLLGMILFLFWIYCVFDVISTDEASVRNLPKYGWLFVVLFLFDSGALAWFILGRPQPASCAPGGAGPPPSRGRTQPMAPDDDPNFARYVEERRRLSN